MEKVRNEDLFPMLCYARHMDGRKKSKGSHFDGQGIPWGSENFCKDINFFSVCSTVGVY